MRFFSLRCLPSANIKPNLNSKYTLNVQVEVDWDKINEKIENEIENEREKRSGGVAGRSSTQKPATH